MVVYWLLFAFFAAIAQIDHVARSRGTANNVGGGGGAPGFGAGQASAVPMMFGGAVLAIVVGLRFEVGGDWQTYEWMYEFARFATLEQMLARGDPAYQLLNWAAYGIGTGVWLVNLVCGALFAWGLVRFARTQASPWTVMLVAMPYLVVVVAMGYTRQGVAIGILMGGLASLLRGGSIPKFALYVFAAALFHKTAIVALLLVLVSARRNLFLNLVFVLAALLASYDVLVSDSVDRLVRNYISAEYNSQGAAIRVAMSLLPAILFLAMRKRFAFRPDEDILWRNFSYAAIVLAALLMVLPSSTVVDRLALYILPLQLAIIARIPAYVLAERFARILIVFYAFAIQFVWLNYAAHAGYWLPYQFYPFAS